MYTRAPGAGRDEAGGERPLRHKIEPPWIYDTANPTSEPPDINYKNLIRSDQKEIDDLLEDESIHFHERCLRYEALDVNLEEALLGEYGAWTKNMSDKAGKNDDERARFFQGLNQAVWDDYHEVRGESRKHQRKRFERQFEQLHSGHGKMNRAAQRLDQVYSVSSSLSYPAQDLSNQGRDEVIASLEGSEAGERGSSAKTGKDECTSSQTSSPFTTSIMAHQEDQITKKRTVAFTATDTGGVKQASTGRDKQDLAGAGSKYSLAFVFLLFFIIYEYESRKIYP